MRSRVAIVASATGAISLTLLFVLTDPLPQDPAYFAFADRRSIFDVPNFMDVSSNLLFLVTGLWGLWVASRIDDQRLPWLIFFGGVALTGFGSAWFHLEPNNATLVWDRLPMTIGFMSLVAIVIGEYYDRRLAQRLLLPLILAGIVSVLYWAWSESRGIGDLRPYAVVQFLPMLALPLVLLLRGRHSPMTYAFWLTLGAYVLAKLFEFFDMEIYAATARVSGHTLKHIAAACAALILLQAIRRSARSPRSSP